MLYTQEFKVNEQLSDGITELVQELHILSAGFKAVVTWEVAKVCNFPLIILYFFIRFQGNNYIQVFIFKSHKGNSLFSRNACHS